MLYFYPKDETICCVQQACRFRDQYEEFLEAGAQVIGVSSDTVESHAAFARKYQLPFLLLSDVDGALRESFGVPKTLGFFQGRVTYVIDYQGIVQLVFSSQLFVGRHPSKALKIVRDLCSK